MRLVKAKLIKLATEDHLVEFFDETPLGKVYIVDADTDSVEELEMYNMDRGVYHRKRVICNIDPVTHANLGWLPVECLEIER